MLKKVLFIHCFLMLAISSSLFAQEVTKIEIGGALRFNYNLSSWKDGQKARGGDFGYDMFRINTKVEHKGIRLNAEYRLYSDYFGGGVLKQGWLAYDFNDNSTIQIGQAQVPFGLTTYNSNNWFFSINYYVGLEDDYDMGLKYIYTKGNWQATVAFFKNAEELRFGSYTDVDPKRYSYDVSSIDLGDGMVYRNKEVNQLNAKLVYNTGEGAFTQQYGVSAQFGGLYNIDTEEVGSQYALAAHYKMQANRLGIKAQVLTYNYDTKHPLGQTDKEIAMAAYGAPYLVASQATNYTFSLSYSLPVNWDPISNLQFYNDFGLMDKAEKSFEDTYMNVAGVLVSAGKVYTYIDVAMGKNQPWLGPVWTDALAVGQAKADWETRFNINIGYYF